MCFFLVVVCARAVMGQCQPVFIGSQPVIMDGSSKAPGLSVSKGWIAVSSMHGQPGHTGPGIVTTLTVDVDGVTFHSIIEDPAAIEYGYFGVDCSINESRLAVTAGSDSPYPAYVFKRVGDAWILEASLDPGPGTVGHSVALSVDALLVGDAGDSRKGTAAGAAYIFHRGSDGIWRQEATLFAPDPKKNANFGSAVALSGNVALIGADEDSTVGSSAGAAYVFRFNGVSWAFEQKLLPDSAEGWFGNSVGLDGGLAVIGAWGEGGAGRAYIYQHDGSSWVREARLASDEFDTEHFGADVAVSNGTVVICDPHSYSSHSEDPLNSGASIYRKVDGVWTRQYRISEPEAGIGFPVAIDGSTVALGYFDSVGIDEKGVSAWNVSCCPPDCNGDGVLNINDFICFQSEWRKRSAYGDYNHDGVWNVNDFIAFQADWRKGCA